MPLFDSPHSNPNRAAHLLVGVGGADARLMHDHGGVAVGKGHTQTPCGAGGGGARREGELRIHSHHTPDAMAKRCTNHDLGGKPREGKRRGDGFTQQNSISNVPRPLYHAPVHHHPTIVGAELQKDPNTDLQNTILFTMILRNEIRIHSNRSNRTLIERIRPVVGLI